MKLSILMVTYNHEKFIARALNSVLMQEVNFEYEIILGEDCSVDNTRKIVLAFQNKYPDKIRLHLHDKNIGAYENFSACFKACKGDYIALLEGDDYWTSPYKLQKQVNFLDKNPDFAICFTRTEVFYEDRKKWSYHSPGNGQKEVSTIEDLLVENFMQTCSVMFRNGLIRDFPEWLSHLKLGDWPFHILNAQYGKIMYLPEIMSAYRIHAGSKWSSHSQVFRCRETIKMLEYINQYLEFKYDTILTSSIRHYSEKIDTLLSGASVKNRIKELFNMKRYIYFITFIKKYGIKAFLNKIIEKIEGDV